MGMKEWAEREVQIACKRENPDRKEGEWDYGCACYESALKAFNSLMEDGHSGMSMGFTKQILSRLIDGKPLTPIEDTDDVWTELADVKDDGFKHYQCNRMYSLFKHVYPDGTVKYSDADRVICIDVETENAYSFGLVRDIIDEMFPIKMPYSAATKYKVYCSDFLYDSKNGDFDTVAVHYVETSDGNRIGIHKYFRPANEDEPEFPNWKEINIVDYVERKEEYDKRGGSVK